MKLKGGNCLIRVPYIRGPNVRNTVCFAGRVVTILVGGEDTEGQYAIMQFNEPRGLEPPFHIHHREDEGVYVIQGEFIFYVQDKATRALPGSYVFIPRGVKHTFSVVTQQATALAFVFPSGFERFVRDVSSPIGYQLPSMSNVQMEFKRLQVVGAKYGTEFLME